MPSPSKESVFLTVLNILLSTLASALSSLKDFPLGVVAGLAVEFIFISILGAAIGTILALKNFHRSWVLGLVLSVLAVLALIYYSRLLALGGLTLRQIFLAGLLYFFIFLVFFFILTYIEELLRQRFLPPSVP
jgi:hypothetical protein